MRLRNCLRRFRKPVKFIARHGVGPHKLHAHDMYSNKKNKRQNARVCRRTAIGADKSKTLACLKTKK